MTSAAGTPRVLRAAPDAEYYTEERCHILELANISADPAVSIARARVAPGVTTALHRVRGTVERYVILAGQGVVQVEGMAAQHVGPEDVVLIPAAAAQSIRNVGDTDLVFLAICSPRFDWGNYVALDTTD